MISKGRKKITLSSQFDDLYIYLEEEEKTISCRGKTLLTNLNPQFKSRYSLGGIKLPTKHSYRVGIQWCECVVNFLVE